MSSIEQYLEVAQRGWSFLYFRELHNPEGGFSYGYKSTIQRVESFWFKAKIPVRHRQDSIKQLEQIFYEWRGLKKNKNRHTETQQANEATFVETIESIVLMTTICLI